MLSFSFTGPLRPWRAGKQFQFRLAATWNMLQQEKWAAYKTYNWSFCLSDRERFRKISVRPATAEFACFNPWRFSFSDSVKNEPISIVKLLCKHCGNGLNQRQRKIRCSCVSLCQFVSVCPDDSSGFLARCWDCQIVFGKRKLILGTKSADYTIIHSSSLFSTCITCNMTNLSTASRKIVDQCVRTCFDARIQKRLTTSTRLSMLVGRKLLDPMST